MGIRWKFDDVNDYLGMMDETIESDYKCLSIFDVVTRGEYECD